ncbi:plasmid segregation oscillating ATPase ParF [Rathayibacter rathayi NCPPB 2980 = VKM Ac-1601]|uniref:Peptide transporter n=1 Tax=Rathayibacter rathayi TaxID=33887 RepID=A0ABX5A7S9_RATRA|nr:ParA family partition ATPase [Rathayibacter rathayi]MWV76097.1 AAA family ATPase [Rathayibacter rathayi NCPPB 2980 = VKM Ac-1601]PPG65155.1 peptide transporter [Rathayibacter rathayi]PPG74204.1 peptide transporter [Rathayibacter rathayi]PPG87531.1 peptide transporter [Rathayibacter rathayi]PPG95103.1 peptide transporter [Rathayibacter rathayi]
MDVIAVLNQKGGAGKTTIATHLARAYQLEGMNTILVDSDPQGSSRDWAAASQGNPVMTVGIDRPTLERDVRRLAADMIIIDGAPQASDLAVSATKAASFVLIPVQPSPYDIWAASDLVELVKQRADITEGKLRAAFVISRAIPGTTLSRDISDALAGYELPVLTTRIHQRQDYPKTAAHGLTVLDQRRNAAAAEEVRTLAAEVLSTLRSDITTHPEEGN